MSSSTHSKSTRRHFLKSTGRVATASALAAAVVPHVHAAEDNTINVALIGCGGRGTGAAANAMSVANGPIKLVAMADVFANVVQNAYDAMEDGGTLSLRCRVEAREQRSYVVIEFEDSGPGIAEDDLAKLFEPFFTTKPKGTGLGLAICHGIISAHGGRIEVESEVGRGTRFAIQIPQQTAASKANASSESELA